MACLSEYILRGNLHVSSFEAVVIAYGSNDLRGNIHFTEVADRVVQGLDRAVKVIRQINPSAKIGVSGILPRDVDEWWNNIPMIHARVYTNVVMRAYCDNHYISYFTSETTLKGRDPRIALFRYEDGIHLSIMGAYYYQLYLEGKVGELLGRNPPTHRPPAILGQP